MEHAIVADYMERVYSSLVTAALIAKLSTHCVGTRDVTSLGALLLRTGKQRQIVY